jgi:acetyl esterase/lipase
VLCLVAVPCQLERAGTQVVETLLYMEHLRSIGDDPGVEVERALTFSCWLDLTSSTPTFFTRKWCTGDCDGMGDPDNKNSPGWVMIKGQCAALEYAGSRPLNDPLISPLHADHSLISKLPPLMMLIGGTEIILSDNIEFGQLAQGLGAPVQVEVFADMWHDFEQESEGCHSASPLAEGQEALRVAGEFLSGNSSVRVVSVGETTQPGAIRWHYSHNMWPPIGREECKCADC